VGPPGARREGPPRTTTCATGSPSTWTPWTTTPSRAASGPADYDLTPGGWSGMAVEELRPAAVLIGLIEREHGLTYC
jgi:hypothetical protein